MSNLESAPENNNNKREREDYDDAQDEHLQKKKKDTKFSKLFLEHLPNAQMYEKSYMHRDTVTHVVVTPITDFIVTGSADGHIKFWKKQPIGIEFVKTFKAHIGPLTSMSVSCDGLFLCTVSVDQSLMLFDVRNFDLINMIRLSFVPSCAEFISTKASGKATVACSDRDSNNIYIFEANSETKPKAVISTIHKTPVRVLKYNEPFNTVISCDNTGVIEYWDPTTFGMPNDVVEFRLKSETDLYEFAKMKTLPRSLHVSSCGKFFVCMGKDRQIRIFRFLSGKLFRKYDESMPIITKLQKQSSIGLDAMEFGRRVTVEQEIDRLCNEYDTQLNNILSNKTPNTTVIVPPPTSTVIFDESSTFILYPSIFGIKVVNIHTNVLSNILGKAESNTRFLNIALYQGKSTGSAATETLNRNAEHDPTLVCSAFRKHRFYLFTRREPTMDESSDGVVLRDIFNERPTKEEQAMLSKPSAKKLGKSAIIHTTRGDIHIKLFGEECPKTVENFTVHSKNGYYNNLIFHRVIKNFMIQTGDPVGDGTGGTSIWGKDFEDEFHRTLKHDRPYTVSMANAGPNTNGSQFFITTVPCPSLDNKHTVFGRAFKGMDVIHDIESVKTDKSDKPLEEIRILSITINFTDD